MWSVNQINHRFVPTYHNHREEEFVLELICLTEFLHAVKAEHGVEPGLVVQLHI